MVSKKSKPIKKRHQKKEIKQVKVIKENPFWTYLSLVLLILVVVSIFTYGFQPTNLAKVKNSLTALLNSNLDGAQKEAVEQALTKLENIQTYSGEKVKVDFYVMSQCPYGTQVEDAFKPVLDTFEDSIDFSLNFISTELADGTFRSLHGEPETLGNIVQLCAIKYNPELYMDMVVCMNQNAGLIPNNWENCAENYNLNVEQIRSCYEGVEGKALLSESIKKSQSVSATGSPTMFIDDEPYAGKRDTLSFMRAVCNKLADHDSCTDIPICAADTDCTTTQGKIGKCINPGLSTAQCVYVEPETVNLIYINDQKCPGCQQYDLLLPQLQQIFQGLEITEYDFDEQKAQSLFDELDLEYLPVFLFDESVKNGEGYQNVVAYLVSAGNYYWLRVGANFDPYAEICDNGIDDRDNDGLIDCNDPDCSEDFLCREEISEKIDLFVMSQCPYGTKALDSMQEVLNNFDNLDFTIHFIATELSDGSFGSLHGQAEVDENIRQSCVMEHYPDNYVYMDYIWCRNKNILSTEWESCAEDNNINVQKIKDCAEGAEGKNLLRERIKMSNGLNIGASPTWMVNNKYIFSGLDAETIKTYYCEYNDVKGCENTLTGSVQGNTGSC